MLATLAEAPLKKKGLVYEPKYDGIRAVVEIARASGVTIWSRNGNDKTRQFPSIARALAEAPIAEALVLDGEIVALDKDGRPAGFQRLQGRMHLAGAKDVERAEQAQPAALILFDIMREGKEDLTALPLSERRTRLARVFDRYFRPKAKATGRRTPSAVRAAEGTIRLSEQVADDATALHERALKEGWEGLIAKDAASPYQPGRRSPAWRKVKLLKEQEFVVGGWTEPRQTRQYFGALLLGVQEGGRLKYVGHTGTGFGTQELARLSALLKKRETKTSPFAEKVKTNEPAHWVRPDLVAQIRFTEWTADDRLRHPVYLGLRDDKSAIEVVREEPARNPTLDRGLQAVIDRLRELEDARKDGELALPNGDRVSVTNLSKVFWPALKLTKGDLLRYYVEVSPCLLPAVDDRPLVMKRFPNGITAKAFYQQRSREERPPKGVRIEVLGEGEPIDEPNAKRLVGGSLTTLVYMAQIAAISQDPWFSRVQSPYDADYTAIDLDPTAGAGFDTVLDVARWVRDELTSLGVPAFPKTSGSNGMHIYIPLKPHTSYESGMLFCQIVATLVATRHPKAATVERMVARRRRGTIYIDYLQNILGKTLATAYSARASDYAGVSTPLTWKEVDAGVDPREFTIRTAPARFRKVGDLWKGLRESEPADLESVLQKYRRA
jgi:bifunctional non-homologous end joining protein LigD